MPYLMFILNRMLAMRNCSHFYLMLFSTRRSSCCLINTADQPLASEPVALSNDIEASDDLEVGVGENQKRTRDGPWWFGGGVYVPDWKVTVGDSFKPSSVCEDVLTHFDSPVVQGSCSSMADELMILKMMMGSIRLPWSFRKKALLVEKEGLKASLIQATSDNKWLIEHEFQQVVNYLLHSSEFKKVLGDVYTELLAHGRHQDLFAGYKAL
ncbi:hypothetical protein Hanom_Chr03g00256961 [Helianthus anomalus]